MQILPLNEGTPLWGGTRKKIASETREERGTGRHDRKRSGISPGMEAGGEQRGADRTPEKGHARSSMGLIYIKKKMSLKEESDHQWVRLVAKNF